MYTDTHVLTPARDPMGAAIMDYQTTGRAGRLWVKSSMFDDDEMPVPHLFRAAADMPPIERRALQMARGRILDVGAGAGCHALALQHQGAEVTAIDISPLSCEAMRLRGVAHVACVNLFDPALAAGYDTILMLMNGTGIAGRAARLPLLMARLRQLLNAGGRVLIDSSDLRYIYENEDGSMDINLNGAYYGEVDYQMVYGQVVGQPFDWLYADYQLLSAAAAQSGLHCSLVLQGSHYDYLAMLEK